MTPIGILYDADRNDTYQIRISQEAVARKMNASVTTVRSGLKSLKAAPSYSTPKSRTVQPLSNSSIDPDAVRAKFYAKC